MVLTEEQKQDVYPAATLENVTYNGGTAINVEDDYYTVNAANVVNQSTATSIPVYQNNNGNPPYNNNPNSNYTANSARLYVLNATTNTNANKTGLGIVLKVMAGDNVNIFGKSYHKRPSGGYTGNTNNVLVNDLINLFAGNALISSKGVTGSQITGQAGFPTTMGGLIGNQPAQSGGRPKAAINWIFFDEQFKWVAGGFDMVNDAGTSTAGTFKNHIITGLPVTKNGYLYVWASNESKFNVFFDNLQLIHNRGPVLEETHYYPFGLTMQGISSKALSFGGAENKKKYQQYEFNSDFDINLYESFYRSHDPQIGRFWQIDPKPALWESGYNSMSNNPVLNIDPLGDTTINGQKYEPQVPDYATYLPNVTVTGVRKKLPPAIFLTPIGCHPTNNDVRIATDVWWESVTKDLDKANGQVMPPRWAFLDNILGHRTIEDPDYDPDSDKLEDRYKTGLVEVDADGYIIGPTYTIGGVKGGTIPIGGIKGNPIPSLSLRAANLSQKIGKNSITIKTTTGHIRYDLVGRAHGHVPTPHSLTYTRNFGPNGLVNFSKPKFPNPITQQDLRIIRNYLKSLK
jgi:RHS repeat-associated protein